VLYYNLLPTIHEEWRQLQDWDDETTRLQAVEVDGEADTGRV